jgi:hypothetical protein
MQGWALGGIAQLVFWYRYWDHFEMDQNQSFWQKKKNQNQETNFDFEWYISCKFSTPETQGGMTYG